MSWRIEHGDCLDVMRAMPDASVDAVVTDPPYGLAFMGREWDHGVPGEPFWVEAMRVAKPGAHLLAFGGTRTFHRLACAIEDAGWEIRDCIMWVYGSGFPKSLDVSKAIDKAAGAERTVQVGISMPPPDWAGYRFGFDEEDILRFKDREISVNTYQKGRRQSYGHPVFAAATDPARQWQGWGTALKPAWEPIIVARKPLDGTVAANVLRHGTGAINVDGCRVGISKRVPGGVSAQSRNIYGAFRGGDTEDNGGHNPNLGRWPANLIHDGSDEVVALFPRTESGTLDFSRHTDNGKASHWRGLAGERAGIFGGDSGSAARFFYCAKASRADRGEGNTHPTVKPTALMRYLCRLVTPPGGTVLDPFCGSGSTGKAATAEGFGFIGIEREAEFVEIAKARIGAATPPAPDLPLFAASGA